MNNTLRIATYNNDLDTLNLHITDAIHTVCDDSDWTLLHYAAAWGRKDVAKLLIDAGIDANATDARGHTALDVAMVYGHDNVALWIM